jgi:hypothetical protein
MLVCLCSGAYPLTCCSVIFALLFRVLQFSSGVIGRTDIWLA